MWTCTIIGPKMDTVELYVPNGDFNVGGGEEKNKHPLFCFELHSYGVQMINGKDAPCRLVPAGPSLPAIPSTISF